jgi:hypothetical protein
MSGMRAGNAPEAIVAGPAIDDGGRTWPSAACPGSRNAIGKADAREGGEPLGTIAKAPGVGSILVPEPFICGASKQPT